MTQVNSTAEVIVIDCIPTWEGILPYLLAVLEDGTTEGKKLAKEELKRMAKAADSFNKSTKLVTIGELEDNGELPKA
jgi:hypothetical protein